MLCYSIETVKTVVVIFPKKTLMYSMLNLIIFDMPFWI